MTPFHFFFSICFALVVFFLVFFYRKLTAQNQLMANTFSDVIKNLQVSVSSLLQDKTQLNSILNNMVEGVLGVDREGKIIAVNPALSMIFGFSTDEVKGRHYLEILRHSELDQLITRVIRNCVENKVFSGQIQELRTFSPDERIFEAHVEPMLREGQCAGALMVLHDITHLRRLEQVRRDFVANVSHELKTPLAAIKGFAETLLTGALEDKKNRTEFVESIEKQANRMAHLVEDLLDLSAIESGQRQLKRMSVSVGTIVAEAIGSISSLAKKKKISLEQDLSAGLPSLNVDKEQLKQVLINLLENAVKYSSESGRILIQAQFQVGSSTMQISVKDNGVGIPAVDLPRIFERFYRVDKARSRELGGTGLGLSIVKHIIEAHGGTVGVESSEGQGSTFHFILPIY